MLGRLFFFFFVPPPLLFKKLLEPSGLNSEKLSLFLSFSIHRVCGNAGNECEGKRLCVSEGKMDLRNVCHTKTSDAFLIKSGFLPATGAQIRVFGGGQWYCWREVLSVLVTRAQQQRRLLNPR